MNPSRSLLSKTQLVLTISPFPSPHPNFFLYFVIPKHFFLVPRIQKVQHNVLLLIYFSFPVLSRENGKVQYCTFPVGQHMLFSGRGIYVENASISVWKPPSVALFDGNHYKFY
ncbi:UNVERIFIED_CONTAM: hypothetical protein K2H54_062475 [Gekko kuhli]